MLRWKLKELVAEYQVKTGETLRHIEISRATGISQNTLSLIANNKPLSLQQKTIDGLLEYMQVKLGRQMTSCDLIQFVSSTTPSPTPTGKRKQKARVSA